MDKVDFILLTSLFILVYIMGMVFGSEIRRVTTEEVVIEEQPLSDWDIMKLAIIKTESEYDSLAVGKGEDWGIFQITPIYVKEANRILGEERYTHEDALCPTKAMEMFEIVNGYYNPEKDIAKAIRKHNPTATSAYAAKVRRNMEEIKRYEEFRKIAR